MSGQSLTDRITAAQHSVTGSAVAKAVCKATTHEVMGPKKKHLDCEYREGTAAPGIPPRLPPSAGIARPGPAHPAGPVGTGSLPGRRSSGWISAEGIPGGRGRRVGDVAMESLGEAARCICSPKGALPAPCAQGPGQCED